MNRLTASVPLLALLTSATPLCGMHKSQTISQLSAFSSTEILSETVAPCTLPVFSDLAEAQSYILRAHCGNLSQIGSDALKKLIENPQGQRILVLAIKKGDASIFDMEQIDLTILKDEEAKTIAHYAAESGNGNTKLLEELAKRGVSFSSVDIHKQLPLHAASSMPQNWETVDWLIKKYPAGINQKDVNGNTPLLLALHARAFHSVDLLMAADALVNIKNRDNQTPLHLAAASGSSYHFDAILKKMPSAFWHEKDNFSKTVLHYMIPPVAHAITNDHAEMVTLFADKYKYVLSKISQTGDSNKQLPVGLALQRALEQNTIDNKARIALFSKMLEATPVTLNTMAYLETIVKHKEDHQEELTTLPEIRKLLEEKSNLLIKKKPMK